VSRTFRPVKEIWGEDSNQFVDHDSLVDILTTIADEVNPNDGQFSYDTVEYNDKTVFWASDGKRFLATMRAANDTDFLHVCDADDDQACVSLIQNLKALADTWERDSLDPKDGSLRLYID